MLKNQKGFSLIELMIVVAIIGILAAIAIPNYQKFQERSKQSEAKGQLAGLFTAETSYFAQYTQYTDRFDAIGFQPVGASIYTVGDTVATVPNTSGPLGTLSCNTNCAAGAGAKNGSCPAVYSATWTCSVSPISVGLPVGSVMNGSAFTAMAGAVLNPSTAVVDTWQVNQDDAVFNAVNGL